ncbi:hypothetical protein CLOM_g5955 [Closterium sp. NIES-68]|nr:hypothetical protein CLOM_g5955 [Closterium sp. NIES-68]GJP82010.1 hypothetical protein CLOP_g12131 [Closterium sp. NIES-67]
MSTRESRSGAPCGIAKAAATECGSRGAINKSRSFPKKARDYMNIITGLVHWASATCHHHKGSSSGSSSNGDLPRVHDSLSCHHQHYQHHQQQHHQHHRQQQEQPHQQHPKQQQHPPPLEFAFCELALTTRGFGPDAMLSMDWAGAIYRGCCHVGRQPATTGHAATATGTPTAKQTSEIYVLSKGESGTRELGKQEEGGAREDSAAALRCCCSACRELTSAECVALRGGCVRVKRWRYLPPSTRSSRSSPSSPSSPSLPPSLSSPSSPSSPALTSTTAADVAGTRSGSRSGGRVARATQGRRNAPAVPAASAAVHPTLPHAAQQQGPVTQGGAVTQGAVTHRGAVTQGAVPHAGERDLMGSLAAAAAHPNLLPVLGFSCVEELLLVFRANPSAHSLESAVARDAMLSGAGSPSSLSSWSARLAVTRQIASGLSHLHAHGFLHGSLHPSNVLLSASTHFRNPHLPDHLSAYEQRWWRHMLRREARAEAAAQIRVQLADYGLPWHARDGPGSAGKRLGCIIFGSARYVDPAFMGSGRYSSASDVYALGVIMKELIWKTGEAAGESSWPIRRSLDRHMSARSVVRAGEGGREGEQREREIGEGGRERGHGGLKERRGLESRTEGSRSETAAGAGVFPTSWSEPGPVTVARRSESASAAAASGRATEAGAGAGTGAGAAAGTRPGPAGASFYAPTAAAAATFESSAKASSEISVHHHQLAARFGPVRYHQATALVQWCTEHNPASRPACSEVEQLVKGMEGMSVVGELQRREMSGRRMRGRQWGLLSRMQSQDP